MCLSRAEQTGRCSTAQKSWQRLGIGEATYTFARFVPPANRSPLQNMVLVARLSIQSATLKRQFLLARPLEVLVCPAGELPGISGIRCDKIPMLF